tara:strand:- start:415 stop:756 length:342 start_codon:yes stop_codon:yes gene_type:complete
LGSAAQEEDKLMGNLPATQEVFTLADIPMQTTTTTNYVTSAKLSKDNINHLDPNRQLFQTMAQHLGPKALEEEKPDDPNDPSSVAHSRIQAAKVTAQMKANIAKVDQRKEMAD